MKDLVSEGFANVVKPYIDNEITTRAKLGAHNLLPNTVQNETVNGITFAVNPDGSINVSGSATSDVTYYISPFIILPDGEYILNGCPNGGSSSTYRLTMTSNNMNVSKGNDVGEGIRFSFNKTNDVNLRPYILIKSGVTIDAIFKPMVRLASDANSAYQPYAMTNRELTDNYNIERAVVSVPATYHGGSAANINFEKRNGVVRAYWAGGTPTFPAQETEYEIGDIPAGFIPSQVQTGYGVDMNSFTKGMYLQLRTNGKIYIFGYNTGTGGTVNSLVSLVYFA